MITTQLLMDYTNYEFTPTGDKVPTWEWTQDGHEIGVRIQIEMVHDEQMLKVISHETKGYVLLTANQGRTHTKTAIDVMQFAEYWDQEEWTLDELVGINEATDQTLSFSGSAAGLHLDFGWGMNMIEKAEIGYRIHTDHGLSYAFGTMAGLAELYPRIDREWQRVKLGWTDRRVADLAKQPS